MQGVSQIPEQFYSIKYIDFSTFFTSKNNVLKINHLISTFFFSL